jgi:large subunit ribosomal protein L10
MILTSETSADILKKAYMQMLSLSNKLPGEALSEELKQSKSIVNVSHDHKPAAEEKPKEEKKEDAAAGLGALFG